MSGGEVLTRRGRESDLAAVARLAAQLVRLHHAFDPQRFMLHEPIEEGYRRWLAQELRNPQAVLLVAERAGAEGEVLGYAYGRLEERDWTVLRDACGELHDVFVDQPARRSGIARTLVQAMIAELSRMGAPRVVLNSAWANHGAQALFAQLGFRPTLVEMTIETGQPDPEAAG